MKKNSKFSQEGAEKLILSNLLIRDVECYQAYENQKSYDLIAISKDGKKTAKIEVKSRHNEYTKNISGSNFKLKNSPFPDFYVSVFIKSYNNKKKLLPNAVEEELLILPTSVVHSKKHISIGKKGTYFYPNKLKDLDKYLNNFELITDFLNN